MISLPPLDKLRQIMSGPGGAPTSYLSSVKWGDEGHHLKEFTSSKLPQMVKIIKGQYQNLGVPSLSSSNLNQVVFLASAGLQLKVIAQCVKFKDAGRRMVPVGPKLSIPENFDGWFEILSEDGRAVKCIESVAELSKRNPKNCLVRDSIKVNLPRPDDPDGVWDKTRTTSPGEVLTLGEIVSGGVARGNRGSGKYLECVTSFGDTVYLPLETRGRFSTIAGDDNISGMHTVKTLLTKRFPLMVRLVHGKAPAGVKIGSQFVPEMRLYSLVEEECLVAMPLASKELGVVPLPSNAALKVLSPKNGDELSQMPEHSVLANKCHSLMLDVSGCMQVCDANAVREIKSSYVFARREVPKAYRTIPMVKRSASDPYGANVNHGLKTHLQRGLSTPNDFSLPADDAAENVSDSDDVRYDEIDQIYDYVRGFAPLPASMRNEFAVIEDHKSQLLPQITQNNGNTSDKNPPDPPPIETIPPRNTTDRTKKSSLQSPQQITVSIVNRTPSLKTKEIYLPHRSQKTRKCSEDHHIYEKIEKRKTGIKLSKIMDAPNGTTLALRPNSAAPRNGGTNAKCDSNNNKKVSYNKRQFHLNPSQNKNRFLKNKGLVATKNNNRQAQRTSWLNSGVKTVATSPLFHIRYKSLTDLLMDTKKSSPESSNGSCGGGKRDSSSSSFSYSSKEDEDCRCSDDNQRRNGARGLSRPKSLSNLVGVESTPKKRLDNHNYYNLVQNDLIKPPELKFHSMPDSTRYAKNHLHSKKLGTLYL